MLCWTPLEVITCALHRSLADFFLWGAWRARNNMQLQKQGNSEEICETEVPSSKKDFFCRGMTREKKLQESILKIFCR